MTSVAGVMPGPAMLATVEVGDKVTFEADRVEGRLTIVSLSA